MTVMHEAPHPLASRLLAARSSCESSCASTTAAAAGGLDPLAEQLIVASPDGEMTDEYTLASEGNDPRLYRWPRRGA